MSASVADRPAGVHTGERSPGDRLGAYFWSDGARRVQTVLGLIWLLDAGLQFQSFMYSRDFLRMLLGMAAGQPRWLHDSMVWSVHLANGDLTLWNTLFALTQAAIGFGLLCRPLVKLTIAGSLVWVLIVWWFGEGFGMLFMNMAQPLTGAPGGVFMYGLIALVAWPNGRRGGLFGIGGAKVMWATLWIVMAWLWLLAPNSSPNATHDALTSVSSGIRPLNSLQSSLASASAGHGLAIASILAVLSAAIGIGVAAEWHPRTWLVVSIVLNVVYWVIPQAFGGIFAGGATDPNSGLLFILLAAAMFMVFPRMAAEPAATEKPEQSLDAPVGLQPDECDR
jgi:hypothetical protein